MFEVLFPARVRRKLLMHFFNAQDKEFYIRELIKDLDESFEPIRKELLRLEQAGLLRSINRANAKYYTVNKDYPLYEELSALIRKATGINSSIKESLSSVADAITYAFLYYPIQNKKNEKGVHMVVVGSINPEALGYLISQLERQIKQKIYYFLYDFVNFKKRISSDDRFLLRILSFPKDLLIGKEREFQALIKKKWVS